jgi:hypothetical protein
MPPRGMSTSWPICANAILIPLPYRPRGIRIRASLYATCYSTEPPKELKELVRKQSVAKATQQNQLSVCMLTFSMLSSPALT